MASGGQIGGRLLGQGVYGCTFDPAPRCAGGSVFKTVQGMPAVGKVTVEDVGHELAIGRDLGRLPLAGQYFAGATTACRPELPIRDPDAASCGIVKEATDGTTFTSLVMPLAGVALLKKSQDLAWVAANFERMFIHLLEGLVILQRAGYVHNDIHMGNVLIDDRGVARYIDFGLSYRVVDIKAWEDANLGRQFRPKHVWQSPEIHCWRMRLAGQRLVDGIGELRKFNEEYRQLEHQFPTRKTAEAALVAFFTEDKTAARRDEVGFLRAYGARADWWRLGLCMWMLWVDLLGWGAIRQSAVWEHRDRIRAALNGLTQFDPRDRMAPEDALRLLDPNSRFVPASAPTTTLPRQA